MVQQRPLNCGGAPPARGAPRILLVNSCGKEVVERAHANDPHLNRRVREPDTAVPIGR
jgi:hypothetical protein